MSEPITNVKAADQRLKYANAAIDSSDRDDWEDSSFAERVSLNLQQAQVNATLAVADEIRALTAALTRMNARADR